MQTPQEHVRNLRQRVSSTKVNAVARQVKKLKRHRVDVVRRKTAALQAFTEAQDAQRSAHLRAIHGDAVDHRRAEQQVSKHRATFCSESLKLQAIDSRIFTLNGKLAMRRQAEAELARLRQDRPDFFVEAEGVC